MKVALILLFILTSSLFAVDANSQIAKVSIKADGVLVEELLTAIENQTEYLFIYNKDEVDVSRKVSVKAHNESVAIVLNTLFEETDVVYAMEGSNIMLMRSAKKEIVKQVHKVTGIVRDEDGFPLIGATITVKGLAVGTVADSNGNFSLEVSENNTIVISYLGYITQERQIGNTKDMLIILKEDMQKLEEVVVTALGIKRSEKGLGYAVQKIEGDKIGVVKGVDSASGLIGKIAGLNVQSSTEFNEAPTLSLRGESPLLVVDGVPSKNVSLRDIASDDIESISVLKGATASALYGADGGAGAIMVVTKRGNKKGGLQVSINSNTMFEAGHLALPEVQTSYSSGSGGKYGSGDFVWGDRLDMGRMAEQYNPENYKWEMTELTSKGKNNLQNFLQSGFITNNNVSVSNRGDNGGFRTSLTHVYNKGQYPNSRLNKITYTMGGDISVDKFTFDFIVNLGDIGLDVGTDTPESASRLMRDVYDRHAEYRGVTLFAIGNHDRNWHFQPINENEWTTRFVVSQARKSNYSYVHKKTYLYYDIERTKTRVIVLDTQDGNNVNRSNNYYSMSEEQLLWLASALQFEDDGWNVIILTHFCANKIGAWNGYPAAMENVDVFDQIMYDFTNKSSGKIRNVNWNFSKNKSNTLIANFCGDSHFDHYIRHQGINRIITQGYGGVSENDLPQGAKKWNRGTNMLIDIVVVKPNKKEFKMFRLGVGEDRFFDFY